MKKITIDAAKLQLHKTVVSQLTNEQMGKVHGGEEGNGGGDTAVNPGNGETDFHFLSINCSHDKTCQKAFDNGHICCPDVTLAHR